jgi:hypothetical protein
VALMILRNDPRPLTERQQLGQLPRMEVMGLFRRLGGHVLIAIRATIIFASGLTRGSTVPQTASDGDGSAVARDKGSVGCLDSLGSPR